MALLEARALCRELLRECVEARQEAKAIQLLTRCSAMVEFGVDVNAKWYRRLREAVAGDQITTAELRSLLNRTTVWWGATRSSAAGDSGLLSLPYRIWQMGRPAGGELHVSDHHWVTKSLLLTVLIFSGSAFAVLTLGGVQQLMTQGATAAIIPTVVAWYTYGLTFWAIWWLGPHSWSAVRRLRNVLNLPVQERDRRVSDAQQ